MKSRLVFIDLLRGWATIVMIEVHVFNAFIIPALKGTGWFGVLNYINGLVAPSFLFVAGFVFVIASQRKLEEFRTFGKAFWRQFGGIGLIWIIAYGLHLPFFSFSRTIHETTETGWLQFYQADILHCIALGLPGPYSNQKGCRLPVVPDSPRVGGGAHCAAHLGR
jgi:predicted acyltransferase